MNDIPVDFLGERLAALRKLNGLSLEAVARLSGLTKSYLSKVERGLSTPSIATVMKLSEALSVTSGQFLAEADPEEIVVVKAAQRVPFRRSAGRAGYAYEAIAAHRADKAMTPFVMRPPFRRGKSIDLVTHPGEELLYVISGEMEIIFKDRRVALGAGDSVYFNASIPHRSRSVGKVLAEALVVVSEPRRGSR